VKVPRAQPPQARGGAQGSRGGSQGARGAYQLGRSAVHAGRNWMGSMVPKVFGQVLIRFPSFGVSRVEMVTSINILSNWSWMRISSEPLSLESMTFDSHFVDSIESGKLFPLGKHIRVAFTALQMYFGGLFEVGAMVSARQSARAARDCCSGSVM
ncbi:hypothetical protein HAX54_038495, partial [Datura stramonium]|nr:hypothetical protein [Datura stramonium]